MAANIEINAVASTGANVPINVAVQLSNADVGGEVTYAWTILDQPEGAANALSNPAIENPTFTPLKEGSYRIRLVVNATLISEATAYAVVSVLQLRSNERLPAAGEILERDTARGWATAQNRLSQRVDKLIGDSNLVLAVASSAVSVGSIVRLDVGSDLLLTGLPGEVRAPLAELAEAGGMDTLVGRLGVIERTCSGGSIGGGVAVLVRIAGAVELVEAGSPAVGDFVLVDDSGEPTLSFTAPTHPVIIGRVIWSSAGAYRWMISDAYRLDRRITSPLEGRDLGGSGTWSLAGDGTDAVAWFTSNTAASGLHLPLHVHAGEVLYRIEAAINQGSTSALMRAVLTRGFHNGAASGSHDSPAVAGISEWNIVPPSGLVLPQELPKFTSFWLWMRSTGAGGTARALGCITAYVRPI